MVLIAYKQMGMGACWAQIRRIRCAACPATFSFVAGGTAHAGTVGVPWLTDDDDMRDSVGQTLNAKLIAIARAKARGLARCAACRSPQPWMLGRWFVEHALGALLALVLLAPVPVLAGSSAAASAQDASTYSWGTFAGVYLVVLAAVAVGGWTCFRWQLGSAARPDPRAMRDDELRALLTDCAARKLDPALTWWWTRVCRTSPPQDVTLVALPLLDLAGGFQTAAGDGV